VRQNIVGFAHGTDRLSLPVLLDVSGSMRRYLSQIAGSYQIHEQDGYVIHKPNLALWPNAVGTSQKRMFKTGHPLHSPDPNL